MTTPTAVASHSEGVAVADTPLTKTRRRSTPTAVASHAYGSGKRRPAPRPRHRRAATEDGRCAIGMSGFSVAAHLRHELRRGLAANGLPLRRRGRRRYAPDKRDGNRMPNSPRRARRRGGGISHRELRLRQWQSQRAQRSLCSTVSFGFFPWLPSFPLCKSSRIQGFSLSPPRNSGYLRGRLL
jgi:hypothetical protein